MDITNYESLGPENQLFKEMVNDMLLTEVKSFQLQPRTPQLDPLVTKFATLTDISIWRIKTKYLGLAWYKRHNPRLGKSFTQDLVKICKSRFNGIHPLQIERIKIPFAKSEILQKYIKHFTRLACDLITLSNKDVPLFIRKIINRRRVYPIMKTRTIGDILINMRYHSRNYINDRERVSYAAPRTLGVRMSYNF